MFKRILVPLDGSSRAEYALAVAARIARASSGSIHILRVVSPPIDYGGGLAEAPLLMEQMIELGWSLLLAISNSWPHCHC